MICIVPSRCLCRRFARVLAVISTLVICGPVRAQLPHTRLDSVFPPGGKIGAQVEVTLQGADLDNADRLVFSHTGITARPKTQTISELLPETQPVPGVFTVAVADNVPPGLYEVRALGHFGVSNPRWFHVDARDNVPETTDNTMPEKAMPISIGTTVSGRSDADRVDYFRFAAQAGQRITIDCLAERIDSRMDASLALYDPTGQEIRRQRDSHGHDPAIAFTAAADGDYTLAVYDFLYRGGADYFYRLSLHRGPHLSHVFPPCVLPGATTQVTLFGHHLPGGKPIAADDAPTPLERLTVDLTLPQRETLLSANEPGAWLHPSGGMLDGWLYRIDSPEGVSNPVLIGAADAPVIVEREPNNEPGQATAVTVPCEFVGQFATRGDRDWAAFTARQGQVFWIEVISHRLGVSCDPVLVVERVSVDAQGNEQVARTTSVDDTDPAASNNPALLLRARSDDPVYRLAVDRDATYRVQIRDLYGSPCAGSQMIYRLAIREQQPDFRIVAYPLPPDRRDKNKVFISSPVLRRGGTMAVEVRLFRRHGFSGDVELTADGLPAGVSCAGATLGGAADTAPLIFVAEQTAPAWSGSIRIMGRAMVGDRDLQHVARPAAVVARSDNLREIPWIARLTQQLHLSVIDSETVPVLLKAGDGKLLETSIGGRLEVPLKVVRRADFAAAGNPVADGLPAGLQVKAGPINNDGGKLELNAANTQIRPGTYTFLVRAPVKQKRLRNAAAIALAETEVNRFEQLVKEKADQLSQVTEAEKPQAEGLLKEAQRLKTEADKHLNTTREANKEREYTYELISTAARLQVHATPIRLTTNPATATLTKGGKAAIEVNVERRFGFDDKVDVLLTPPPGVPGISARQISIAKGQSTGPLEITANEQAKPGEYTFQLVGRLKFNDVSLEEKQPLQIQLKED